MLLHPSHQVVAESYFFYERGACLERSKAVGLMRSEFLICSPMTTHLSPMSENRNFALGWIRIPLWETGLWAVQKCRQPFVSRWPISPAVEGWGGTQLLDESATTRVSSLLRNTCRAPVEDSWRMVRLYFSSCLDHSHFFFMYNASPVVYFWSRLSVFPSVFP